MAETRVILGPPGTGKCFAGGTPIIMYDGSVKPVEQIRVGDLLLGPDSLSRTVLALGQGEADLFRVRQRKGDDYVVNADHILSLITSGYVTSSTKRKGVRKKNHSTGQRIEMTVRDYLALSKDKARHLKGHKSEAIEFETKPLRIPPYIMGIWLGDGSSKESAITNVDPEVLSEWYKFAESRDLSISVQGGITHRISFNGNRKGVPLLCNSVKTDLRHYGVFGNKHIPAEYLINSKENRLQLLAGLIDSDGYKGREGCLEYTSVRKNLAHQVAFLARSLGFFASVTTKMNACTNGKNKAKMPYWRVCVSGMLDQIPVKVPRRRFTENELHKNKNFLVTGIEIEPAGFGTYYGFTLSGDGLFLLGDFTVTHNTTALLNLVDQYLTSGGVPERMGFISFTKKAVEEARNRAARRFALPMSRFDHFRTIHSLAFRRLGMTRPEVMQRNHYQELGRIIGMRITGIHRQDQQVYEMPEGDQLCFIESLARLTCQSLYDTWADQNCDIDYEKLKYYHKSLETYKKAKLLYDFTDMLERFQVEATAPELDVLFVDEAQDLCRLQWKVVDKLSAASRITYIAGDDDQAIFRWSGADIDRFLQISKTDKVRVLDQSYRIPVKIFDLSQTILRSVPDRTPKPYRPTAEQGSVEYLDSLEAVNMDKGEWLILARNGYMVRDIEAELRRWGYPYQTAYFSTQGDETLTAAFAWEALRAGGKIKAKDLALVKRYIKGPWVGTMPEDPDALIGWDELLKAGYVAPKGARPIWHEALDRIPVEDREFYIAARRRGEAFNRPPRIRVSTIHGAKGGESQNVVLFCDMSLRTYRSMIERPEDEARVFYVGVTRSKQNLYIVQPQTNNYFQL